MIGGEYMLVLNVLVEHGAYSLNRPFSYFYNGTKSVKKGMRVPIEFNNRILVGYIVSVEETSLSCEEFEAMRGYKVKSIEDIYDDDSLLNDELMQLAEELSNRYFAPLISVLQTMLPPSLKPASAFLKNAKIAHEKWIEIVDNNEENLTAKQCELLRFIANVKKVKKNEIKQLSPLSTLLKLGLVKEIKVEKMRFVHRDDLQNAKVHSLTSHQLDVVNEFLTSDDEVYLLEGVTGSGKTEVYISLAHQAIRNGQDVIILVPEISLTPLMMERFYRDFSGKIAIFHSELSSGEKYDEYRRIARGEVRIVIGTRSAIFAPLNNLGLIIIDEEHVESYKQDVMPCYHAREVAIMRIKHFKNAKVLLGSATPTLESRARAMKHVYHLLELKTRINEKALPSTEIINLQDHSNVDYISSLLSLRLREAIKESLEKKEQVVLLLNRRGYASSYMCRDCGHVICCPECEIPLTYHSGDKMLKCHYCGHVEFVSTRCPNCDSKYLTRIGFGVEKIEEEVLRIFPNARTLRLDSDVGRIKNNIARTLEKFRNQEADILIGTQMIAKGHDFSNVTLVGVVLADIGLTLPSYRASERTFQLITQAIGRAGRADKTGRAIIQTYMPDHYSIKLGAKQDYATFFKEEMRTRKLQLYPPYVFLTSISVTVTKENQVDEVALNIFQKLNESLEGKATVIGPVTPYISKFNNGYRRQILIKYRSLEDVRDELVSLIKLFMNKGGISIRIDVDAIDV